MNLRQTLKAATLAAFLAFPAAGLDDPKGGEHKGERKQFSVDIAFSASFGTTVTNEWGTHYTVGGYTRSEDKVYPSEYWGTYPLYFFGTPTVVSVTITNHGPRAKAKFRITTEAYVLLTDGSSGVALTDPRAVDLELGRGETRVIDGTFTAYYTPGVESGLDRFLVYVQHVNEGGGPGNAWPSLIAVEEGVFCPPEYAAEAFFESF